MINWVQDILSILADLIDSINEDCLFIIKQSAEKLIKNLLSY